MKRKAGIIDRRGFSLMELMVVLAVIAILATIAAPNLAVWREKMKLKATARELFSNMQSVRMSAVKNNSSAQISFDVATNSYTIHGTDGNNVVKLKEGVCYGHGVAFDPKGSSFGDDNVTYQGNEAEFNSRGTGKAGYVYLTLIDKGDPVYAVGGASSGMVKSLRWTGSGWE